MDKMKKYLIYIVLLILFALLTEFLIAVGLNSSYKQMENSSNNNIPQVEIYQAESTKVNGRIRGVIKNDETNPIKEKYLKFDFFTDRGINMGGKYIEIDKDKTEQPFEIFFKKDNVSHYETSLVNEDDLKQNSSSSKGFSLENLSLGDIEFLPNDLNTKDIVIYTMLAILLFK